MLALVAALGATLWSAGPASAGTLLDSALGCEKDGLSRPFLRWLDPLTYGLLPNGAFEQGASRWSLAGGAKVSGGNEPYYVHSPSDAYSLSIPAGASATSASVCVGLADPTVRFLAKGPLLSTLTVDVLYEDVSGRVRSLTVGAVEGTGSWQPTLPVAFLTNLTAPLSLDGETTAVAFRFRVTGLLSGTWRVDDVYVDPFKIS